MPVVIFDSRSSSARNASSRFNSGCAATSGSSISANSSSLSVLSRLTMTESEENICPSTMHVPSLASSKHQPVSLYQQELQFRPRQEQKQVRRRQQQELRRIH